MHKNLPLILTYVNTMRGKKYTKVTPRNARAIIFPSMVESRKLTMWVVV